MSFGQKAFIGLPLLSSRLLSFQLLTDSSVKRSCETHATVVQTLYWEGLAVLGLLYEGRNSHWPVRWRVFIYSLGMNPKSVLAWGAAAMCWGLLLLWPPDQRVPLVAVCRCSDQQETQQGCWQCETVRERALLSTDSSKKKMIFKALTALHIVWQNTDKRLMIPVSPVMIGRPVQPNDTPALMFQGFTETGVSSVKHLWPAGSHWQRLALPLPGDIKCGRTVGSADTRSYKHQVKQPHLCKPTNHLPPYVCVYVDLMSCIDRPCPLFTQIRQFLEPGRKKRESWLKAQICLAKFAKKDFTTLLQYTVMHCLMKHNNRQYNLQVCNS